MFIYRSPSHTYKKLPIWEFGIFCRTLIKFIPPLLVYFCLSWEKLVMQRIYIEKTLYNLVLPCIVPPGDSENFTQGWSERGGRGQTKGVVEGCSCKYHHQGVDGRIGAVWAGTSAPSLCIQFYVTDGNIMYLTDASRSLISCMIQHYAPVVGWGGWRNRCIMLIMTLEPSWRQTLRLPPPGIEPGSPASQAGTLPNELSRQLTPVLRIRDFYPRSRILIFSHPGSWIQNSNKREGWKKS